MRKSYKTTKKSSKLLKMDDSFVFMYDILMQNVENTVVLQTKLKQFQKYTQLNN